MTEDHGLADRDGAVDVAEGLVFLLLIVAFNEVLLDVVQRLLLPPQPDDDGVVGNDTLGKLHHRLVIGGWEQQHLAAAAQLPGNVKDFDQEIQGRKRAARIQM